jgi:hypothetical protein
LKALRRWFLAGSSGILYWLLLCIVSCWLEGRAKEEHRSFSIANVLQEWSRVTGELDEAGWCGALCD